MPHAVTANPPAQTGVVVGFCTQPVQQAPLTHRPPAQAVRLATFAPSVQTGAPVVQEMTPALHGFELVAHDAPDEQATQLPVLHTPPGHAVPVPTLPDSTQTPAPEEQSMLPVLHGLAGVQLAPPLQGLHEPALHTPPGQDVPFVLLLALAHTPLPDEQSMLPF